MGFGAPAGDAKDAESASIGDGAVRVGVVRTGIRAAGLHALGGFDTCAGLGRGGVGVGVGAGTLRGLQSCAVAVGAGGVDGRRGAKGAAFCVLSGTFLAGCVGATVAVVIA
tara:strand:- start:733 stop:1065 length:333 start_codon:yes stop_codon:yes gene_type:complete